MSRSIQIHPLAEIELKEASDYYDSAATGLREAFADEVERGLQLLAEYPELGVVVKKGVRKLALKQFPYSLFYKIREEGLRILAVGHQSRRPFYWRKRQ